MRLPSRGDRPTRRHDRLRHARPSERRGGNTTAIALVLLGVSTVAFGIGVGIVSAIQDDLVHAAGQVAAPGPDDEAEEADALAGVMQRLEQEQRRFAAAGRDDGTPATPEPGDAGRGGNTGFTR